MASNVYNILQFDINHWRKFGNNLSMTNFPADRTMCYVCYHQKRIYVQCATLWANKHMLSTITTKIRLSNLRYLGNMGLFLSWVLGLMKYSRENKRGTPYTRLPLVLVTPRTDAINLVNWTRSSNSIGECSLGT